MGEECHSCWRENWSTFWPDIRLDSTVRFSKECEFSFGQMLYFPICSRNIRNFISFIAVWSFNTETDLWSYIEVKGDIPVRWCLFQDWYIHCLIFMQNDKKLSPDYLCQVARSGHTVIRAGPVLILFGGEDGKGKKLHDLHMFDLKSSTWLPLNYKWVILV